MITVVAFNVRSGNRSEPGEHDRLVVLDDRERFLTAALNEGREARAGDRRIADLWERRIHRLTREMWFWVGRLFDRLIFFCSGLLPSAVGADDRESTR